MKKIIYTALFTILLLLLSGCDSVIGEPSTGHIPNRGTWHGNIYVNEFMGFQFRLPETWFMFTDEERNELYVIAKEHFHTLGINNPISPKEIHHNLQDMRAACFFSRSYITVNIQELSSITTEHITEVEYLERFGLYELRKGLQVTHVAEHPVLLDGVNWHYMVFEYMQGHMQAVFVNILDGFLRSFIIFIFEGDMESIDYIMGYFSSIESRFLNVEGVIPTMNNSVANVSRGTWDGHVYTNPSLGLKFAVPTHYDIHVDSEIANILDVCVSFFEGDLISNDFWINVIRAGGVIPIMGAYNPISHTDVLLFVRRVPLGMSDFSTERYLETFRLTDTHWTNQGLETQVSILQEPAIIAGHKWVAGQVAVPDIEHVAITFITIVNDHIWMLEIYSYCEYELPDILSMFSQI